VGALADDRLRTAVVGGGPGGLMYALLAKQRHPGHQIDVYERNPQGATFGFGVVFSERTLGGFAAADPALHAAMSSAGVAWEDIEVRQSGARLRCGGHGFSAIARKTLLQLMQDRAQEVGVRVHFETEADPAALEAADLIVAADGVNSVVRERRRTAFAPAFEQGDARYIWFATRQPFDALTFVFADDEHGQWGLHAYPFEDGTSTFIVETDEATWRRAGLDQVGELPPGQSDLVSLRYCQRLFAEHLGGHELLENNSRWLTFRTLRCDAWRDGNVVLLGDAAHTAHFSVGSGTKMAIEDAIALADAVAEASEIGGALARYEARRRPAVERIQAAARPSLIWWERFRHLRGRSPEQFAFHFLTRSPAVTRGRLLRRDARFVRRVDGWAATSSDAATPLAASLALAGLRLPSRLVVTAASVPDPVVAAAAPALGGAGLVLTLGTQRWPEIAAWLHAHTGAAAGVQLGPGAAQSTVAAAAQAGMDVLAVEWDCAAVAAWPADRPLLALMTAPEDSEGATADTLLQALGQLAGERACIVGVRGADPDAGPERALLFADRVVQELGVTCCLVDALPDDDAVQTALLAGRAQLVLGRPSLVCSRWGPAVPQP
jgi:2-polyprenyl-6-methoxyphenol hydroxylase-like FAD-dependent oxidoreductase